MMFFKLYSTTLLTKQVRRLASGLIRPSLSCTTITFAKKMFFKEFLSTATLAGKLNCKHFVFLYPSTPLYYSLILLFLKPPNYLYVNNLEHCLFIFETMSQYIEHGGINILLYNFSCVTCFAFMTRYSSHG